MRVLVTGGAGFVGTNLIKRLLKDGHRVDCYDDYSTGFRKNNQDGCMYYTIDIRDPFLTQVKFDVIFHMAALPRIKPSFENPKEVMEVNVNGTLNILEYARKNDIPVIYAGSSSVHGGVYKNPYTFSKWQGEELCNMYRKIYKLKISICRFYNVYGDHMPTSGGYRTVIPIFLEQYKNKETFTITGDGEQRRDFTHVGDIVDAMIKVMELNEYGNTFELGRGKNYSMKEVVKMFPDSKWTFIPNIPGEVKETLCESKFTREKLNWKPKINLKEWLEKQL